MPLAPSTASACPIRITRLLPDGTRCEARREDADGRLVRCSVARLLAVDETGAGRHYRFVGHVPRQYDTHALIVEIGGDWAQLILPEWHPEQLVSTAARALPEALRSPGRWVRCKADLGARAPSKLMPSRYGEPRQAFRPDLLPDPVVPTGPDEPDAAGPPEAGEGCGDVVLFLSADEAARLRHGIREHFLTGHPPPVTRGDRVYVHDGSAVVGWRPVDARLPLPTGTRLRFGDQWTAVRVTADLRQPAVGIAGGVRGRQQWTWRSWPRTAEAVHNPNA